MATTKDYFNRKLDIALFGETVSGVPIDMGTRPTSLVITGKLKASQNYLRVMLSNLGERKEDSLLGSTLIKNLKSSNIAFTSEIQQIFLIENVLVLKWIKERYNNDVPNDERIDNVKLKNFSIQPGGKVILDLELTTVAGESLPFHLPIIWSNN
jgi:hypothetical protein